MCHRDFRKLTKIFVKLDFRKSDDKLWRQKVVFKLFESNDQCDQTARLLFNFLALCSIEYLPNSIKSLPK